MNARYYDPQLGALLSPDTVVPDAGAVIDYNRYLYARGNPLRYADPSGHCEETPDDDDAECWHLLQHLMDDPEVGSLYDYEEASRWNGEQLDKLLQYWSEHGTDEFTPDATAIGVGIAASFSKLPLVEGGVKAGVEFVSNHKSGEKSVFVYGGGHIQFSLNHIAQSSKLAAPSKAARVNGVVYVAEIYNLPSNEKYKGEFATNDYTATYGALGVAYGQFQVPGNPEGPHGTYVGWAPGIGFDLAAAGSKVWYSSPLQIGGGR